MLTEEFINQDHKARYAAAAKKYGGPFKVPSDVAMQIGEATRLLWVEFVNSGGAVEGTQPTRKNNTKERIVEYLKSLPAASEFSAADVATGANCSLPTVYTYLKDYGHEFLTISRGRYAWVNPEIERAKLKEK